ncbi:MAG TPA: hypothetical protein ENI81_03695 [Phycisphaerales bacterium]|nr:hypothetical protein [Phycisphaerales bacterium]
MADFFRLFDEGVWKPSMDRIEVGHDYVELQNLRYQDGLEGVAGYTKLTTTPEPFFDAYEPAVSGDDGFDDSGFDNSSAYITTASAFIRFPSIAWDKDDTLIGVYLRVEAYEDSDTAETLVLAFAAADDQAAPTDADELAALTLTGETITWVLGDWTAGEAYDSPDLSASLQEVVNRTGWATGQAVVLVISGAGNRKFSSFDGATAPVLFVG